MGPPGDGPAPSPVSEEDPTAEASGARAGAGLQPAGAPDARARGEPHVLCRRPLLGPAH